MDKEEGFSVHSYCAGVIFGITLISLFLISVNLPAFVGWIYDHETLFAGILALLAALLTTTILVLQIAQERSHKERIRIQKLKASRAVLPLFLSSLTEYAEKSLDLSFRMLKGEDFEPEVPRFADGQIEVVKECIEYSLGREQKNLIHMLETLQVQQSRMLFHTETYTPWAEDLRIENRQSGNQVADGRVSAAGGYMESSVKLWFCIQPIWGFARIEEEELNYKPDITDIRAIFFRAKNSPDHWPSFYKRLKSLYSITEDPWEE